MNAQKQEGNPFAQSGLFVNTADIWTPYKMSFEGFAGGGKTLTMCCIALGIWEAEGKTGNVVLQDTERSAKFIKPFFHQFGLIEGKNFFVTHSRSLQRWGEILAIAEKQRGTIFLTDTVTHIYEEMMIQFERDNNRKVKYPQDAMIIKPMWKEKFSTPFTAAINTHLLFTGRAAWEYTMSVDEDTGKKEFNATGVKMRGDNELAYEPDVVVLMERLQKITDDGVQTARCATILKDRSRLIDGQQFVFKPWEKGKDKEGQIKVWEVFEPVYRLLASGNKDAAVTTDADRSLGPLFQKGAGEAWYQQRVRAERIVEEIGGIYNQWGMGGSGTLEKSLRATLNLMVFGQRTTVSLIELHPDQLRDGADLIDHLVRYAAKNIEPIEKMFKAGQYESMNAFLAEEKDRFIEERNKATPSDDDIPEFKSGSNGNGAGKELPLGDGKTPADTAAVIVENIVQSLKEAESAGRADEIVADLAPVIDKMDPEQRYQVFKARDARKLALKKTERRQAGA